MYLTLNALIPLLYLLVLGYKETENKTSFSAVELSSGKQRMFAIIVSMYLIGHQTSPSLNRLKPSDYQANNNPMAPTL